MPRVIAIEINFHQSVDRMEKHTFHRVMLDAVIHKLKMGKHNFQNVNALHHVSLMKLSKRRAKMINYNFDL